MSWPVELGREESRRHLQNHETVAQVNDVWRTYRDSAKRPLRDCESVGVSLGPGARSCESTDSGGGPHGDHTLCVIVNDLRVYERNAWLPCGGEDGAVECRSRLRRGAPPGECGGESVGDVGAGDGGSCQACLSRRLGGSACRRLTTRRNPSRSGRGSRLRRRFHRRTAVRRRATIATAGPCACASGAARRPCRAAARRTPSPGQWGTLPNRLGDVLTPGHWVACHLQRHAATDTAMGRQSSRRPQRAHHTPSHAYVPPSSASNVE